MKQWAMSDTQNWISQVELRIEDMHYYLKKATEWCEDNNITDDITVFSCVVMTVVWVAYMRGEEVSKAEVFELLNLPCPTDHSLIYTLNDEYKDLSHAELLEEIALKPRRAA
jgi:hypothetical protein